MTLDERLNSIREDLKSLDALLEVELPTVDYEHLLDRVNSELDAIRAGAIQRTEEQKEMSGLVIDGRKAEVVGLRIDSCDGCLHEFVLDRDTGKYEWVIWEDGDEDNTTLRTSHPTKPALVDVRVLYCHRGSLK